MAHCPTHNSAHDNRISRVQAFRGHSVQTDYRITFKIPHVTLIIEQYIYVYICVCVYMCVYKIRKSYNINFMVQYHSLLSPNCLNKSLCITHEVPSLIVFKFFSNIQFVTAIFETRSTQHATNTTLAGYQTTKCWKLFCVAWGEARDGGPEAIFLPQLCACPQARWANGKALPSNTGSITQIQSARN